MAELWQAKEKEKERAHDAWLEKQAMSGPPEDKKPLRKATPAQVGQHPPPSSSWQSCFLLSCLGIWLTIQAAMLTEVLQACSSDLMQGTRLSSAC